MVWCSIPTWMVDLYGKCREIYHTWILWGVVMIQVVGYPSRLGHKWSDMGSPTPIDFQRRFIVQLFWQRRFILGKTVYFPVLCAPQITSLASQQEIPEPPRHWMLVQAFPRTRTAQNGGPLQKWAPSQLRSLFKWSDISIPYINGLLKKRGNFTGVKFHPQKGSYGLLLIPSGKLT